MVKDFMQVATTFIIIAKCWRTQCKVLYQCEYQWENHFSGNSTI